MNDIQFIVLYIINIFHTIVRNAIKNRAVPPGTALLLFITYDINIQLSP